MISRPSTVIWPPACSAVKPTINDPLKGQKDSGLLSKLAFWSSDDEEKVQHYQIKLSDDGEDTRVVVLNKDGGPEISVTGVRILTLLYEELK